MSAGAVLLLQGGMPVLADPSELPVLQPGVRPDRTRDGVLLVQTIASLAVAAPIPLSMTAFRQV